MVQYRKYYPVNDPKEYWKLLPYLGFAIVLKRLKDRGIKGFDAKTSIDRLEYVDSRIQRGMLVYETCNFTELKTFFARRRISGRISKTKTGTRAKKSLVSRLETADENATFGYFLDLPAELRVLIYVHYLKQLRSATPAEQAYAQPPISAVSKLIRKEVLPEFYKIFTVTLDIATAVHTNEILAPKLQSAKEFMWRVPRETLSHLPVLEMQGVITSRWVPDAGSWKIKLELHEGKFKVEVEEVTNAFYKASVFKGKEPARVQQIIEARVQEFVKQRRTSDGRIQLRPHDVRAVEALFQPTTEESEYWHAQE